MIAQREAPIDYAGAGGVARLYQDLNDWRTAQNDVDDMIDVGTHKAHPRRHGLNFILSASSHFKGYYGTDATRDIWVGTNDWGTFLPKLSADDDEALARVFNWLDLFVEIHGLTAPEPKAWITDDRPYFDVLGELRKMAKDPSLRPGDGSLRAAHVYIHNICKDRSHRVSEIATILRDNIAAMMIHKATLLRCSDTSGTLDALAHRMSPDQDPWAIFLNAIEQLDANHRSMHSRYGGARDLITG